MIFDSGKKVYEITLKIDERLEDDNDRELKNLIARSMSGDHFADFELFDWLAKYTRPMVPYKRTKREKPNFRIVNDHIIILQWDL